MYDKKTVIKAFDNLRRFADTDVHPIVSPDNWNVYSKLRDLIDQAEEDALALLKEQEAVKPEKEHSGSGITWWNVCGNCKTAINPNDKYCHECGRPVLWEGR